MGLQFNPPQTPIRQKRWNVRTHAEVHRPELVCTFNYWNSAAERGIEFMDKVHQVHGREKVMDNKCGLNVTRLKDATAGQKVLACLARFNADLDGFCNPSPGAPLRPNYGEGPHTPTDRRTGRNLTFNGASSSMVVDDPTRTLIFSAGAASSDRSGIEGNSTITEESENTVNALSESFGSMTVLSELPSALPDVTALPPLPCTVPAVPSSWNPSETTENTPVPNTTQACDAAAEEDSDGVVRTLQFNPAG